MMAGRILTLQRQGRELGRLRTGYTEGNRPVRSTTWIVTSHSETYVRAAAEEFGGTPEPWTPQGSGATQQWRVITEQTAIDAVMPPGDPLSQTLELWSGGGCQRRCDGERELLSDKPCICLAEHGDDWHEQPKGRVCATTSRLNVILPDLPDIGIYRVETHSYWAASEIAATVDLIRHATQSQSAVPIRLRIEQRSRVANGQTKKFPVVVVELRGATAGQILGGVVPGISAGAQAALNGGAARAIEANGSAPDWAELIDGATTREELAAVFEQAKAARANDAVFEAALKARAETLGIPLKEQAQSASVDELWMRVLSTAPDGWTTEDVEIDFKSATGVDVAQATAADMEKYLTIKASA